MTPSPRFDASQFLGREARPEIGWHLCMLKKRESSIALLYRLYLFPGAALR
jgi:hypothetical protein